MKKIIISIGVLTLILFPSCKKQEKTQKQNQTQENKNLTNEETANLDKKIVDFASCKNSGGLVSKEEPRSCRINDKTYFEETEGKSNCKEDQLIIEKLILSKNTCELDSDCILLNQNTENVGCPFGCNRLVKKDTDFQEIEELAKNYYEKCQKCTYKCPPPPSEEDIKCIDKKCVNKKIPSQELKNKEEKENIECREHTECASGVCNHFKTENGFCAATKCSEGETTDNYNFYCDENGNWQKTKKEKESCENDFECYQPNCFMNPVCEAGPIPYSTAKCKENICVIETEQNECEKVGLKKILTKDDCDNMAQRILETICAPCGDTVCDDEIENICNCPEDCLKKEDLEKKDEKIEEKNKENDMVLEVKEN